MGFGWISNFFSRSSKFSEVVEAFELVQDDDENEINKLEIKEEGEEGGFEEVGNVSELKCDVTMGESFQKNDDEGEGGDYFQVGVEDLEVIQIHGEMGQLKTDENFITSSDDEHDRESPFGSTSNEQDVPDKCDDENQNQVLYKCPFCFTVFAEADGLKKHLLAHWVDLSLLKKSVEGSIIKNEVPIPSSSKLPPCEVVLTRCNNLTGLSYASANLLKATFDEEMETDILGEEIVANDNHRSKRIRARKSPCCGTCSKSSSSMAKHNAQCHLATNTQDKRHKCPFCPKAYTQQGNLNLHIRSHTGERPYMCEICSKAFSYPTSLKVHSLSHKKNEGKSLQKCQECGISFVSKVALDGHNLLHHWEEESLLQLPVRSETIKVENAQNSALDIPPCWVELTRCDQKPSSTNIGIKGSNKSGRKSIVPEIGRTNKKDSKYQRQLYPQLKRKFHCTLCFKGFHCRQLLELHNFTHTKEKNYKCPLCPKSFTQPGNVNLHIRTHTREMPYKCEICSRAFAQLSHLQHHTNTHNVIKPYKCLMCPKTFSQQFNLKLHIFTHNGSKPYKCSSCPKVFGKPGSLKIHIRQHSGERPYACSKCNKRYTSGTTLKRHFKRIHTSSNQG